MLILDPIAAGRKITSIGNDSTVCFSILFNSQLQSSEYLRSLAVAFLEYGLGFKEVRGEAGETTLELAPYVSYENTSKVL